MNGRLFFWLVQMRERLWVRPLAYCVIAVAIAFLAYLADLVGIRIRIEFISIGTTEKLLTIISSTMLAVATFAVGSMISAYSSASSTATPRAFALVVADDVSQASLSSFIGAFIFSIVAIVAVRTGLYGPAGQAVLFVTTILIFAWVIVTFVRWVDVIARLGRVGNTIERVEVAAMGMITARCAEPFLGGVRADTDAPLEGIDVQAVETGFICFIDMAALQRVAENLSTEIEILALPGAFMTPHRPLVRVASGEVALSDELSARIREAVIIGRERTFEVDPRYALVVLSEIAARALSPGINDPGTAIAIVGRFVRLFAKWAERRRGEDVPSPKYDRIRVPELETADMFDDAFTAIARDGSTIVELGIRLQSAFRTLAEFDDPEMHAQARRHSEQALRRFEKGLTLKEDLDRVASHAEKLGASRQK